MFVIRRSTIGRRAAASAAVAAVAAALTASALTAPAAADLGPPAGGQRGRVGIQSEDENKVRGVKPFFVDESAARLAPYGSVAPGEYTDALSSLRRLPSNGSRWGEVTDQAYDSDDPRYRDSVFSNSGSGSRDVAGRITGLAVGNGWMFAAGANGGVFRKRTTGHAWTPISDGILSLSSGDLVYEPRQDVLWFATGEANTGATSYTGAGVYRLAHATTGRFTDADRVGGEELESRGINQLKFDGAGGVYAATTRGLFKHSTSPKRQKDRWTLAFMPNPASDSDISKPYDNIVNDVLVQPGTGGRVVLINAAWRAGAAYNGFYVSTQAGRSGSFARVNLPGDIDNSDLGNAEFAASATGKRYYLVLERPSGIGTETALQGVFTAQGSVTGPWTRIADSEKLTDSGSALKNQEGYHVGVQAWYNNFVEVDPKHPEHVYLGLEEVFESENGGATWKVIGPYWNTPFPCFDPKKADAGCPQTTHPDQHSIAIAGDAVYVGNDGGVKSRPLDPARSTEDSLGHATDWTNHSSGLRTLQYYSVGVGRDPNGHGNLVFGGLQDNGGALLRAGARKQVSPFGGDGGDSIVNPRNGCNIVDEYTNLVLWMTRTCGLSNAANDSDIIDITVPDVSSRFTAPFRVVRGSKNIGDGRSERWVAGGNSVWKHDFAFSYTELQADADEANGWQKLYATDSDGARLVVGLDAVADPRHPTDYARDTVYAAWCGESNCNSAGFTRGIATNWGGAWTELDMTGLPNRYPNAVTIDPADRSNSTVYVAFNGFNRRFVEGPGAGVKHVFKGKLAKKAGGGVTVTWTDLSVGFPDVPATDVVVVGNKLVVGTDLGVLVADKNATPGRIRWERVGANAGRGGALPLTAVFDLHVGIDGNLYAATHGRGIWRTRLSGL
ncbi:MAG: hypothetical protein JWN54_1856 [Mycobacterium sp.]|nr:hypothetical protein [Mycobacterium sp.]